MQQVGEAVKEIVVVPMFELVLSPSMKRILDLQQESHWPWQQQDAGVPAYPSPVIDKTRRIDIVVISVVKIN